MSLREMILAASDLPRKAVEVPEWDCTVWVRTMTGTERDAFERLFVDSGKPKREVPENARVRLLALTLCDEHGERLFADSADDIAALGGKSAAAIDRLFGVAQRVNGLSDESIEEMEKNSASAPSDGSGTV